MSFSSQVKAELASVENTPCCMHAQTYGLLLFSRAFSFFDISMQTDTELIARLYCDGILRETGIEAQMSQSASGKFKVCVRTAAQRQQVMSAFGHEKGELVLRLNRANLTGELSQGQRFPAFADNIEYCKCFGEDLYVADLFIEHAEQTP